MWKRIPMLLLLVVPYGLLRMLDYRYKWMSWTLSVYAIVLLCNAIYAFLLPRLGLRADQILLWNMLLKLGHAPFYITVFYGIALTFILSIPLILPVAVLEYALLLSTSMFGVNGLRSARRSGELSIGTVIVHAVLHFFFCLDVISAVICYIKIRRVRKQNRTLPEASAAE